MVQAEQMEELENLRKQHELLKKMLEQQHQLRALQGRQEALMAMQESAEQAIAAIEDTGKKSDMDAGPCRLKGLFLLQSGIMTSALQQSVKHDVNAWRSQPCPVRLIPLTLIVLASCHRNNRQRFRTEHHFRTE